MIDNIISKRDVINRVLVKLQTKSKQIFVLGMPNTLIIETGAVCPLHCPFCPQSRDDFDLTRELLTFDNFKKIIDYFENFVDTVLLFNWGEPLLNPDLSEMIVYASERKIRTVVHSNLNFLTEELAEKLIKSGLSELVSSIDGVSEESYQAYRRGGSFNIAINNLKLLLHKRKQLGMGMPNIIWKFLVFKQNEHEIEKARRIAQQIEVPIDFKFAVAPGEFEPTLEKYSNSDFINKFIRDYGLPCEQLWRAPVICPDGSVLPCCMVSHKKYIVGNLFEQDFKSIWNNEKYQLIRKIVTGKMSKSDSSFFCYNCVFGPSKNI
jgi:radical SAM protein with 4Fe4S-binding SPASM domain